MRIGVAGCLHETNSFAPGTTEQSAFGKEWIIGREAFYGNYEGTKTSMGGAIDAAEHHGFELVPLFYTQATPSGTVSKHAMDRMEETLCAEIEKASNDLDGLLLIFHGAMVSENMQDVEGTLLKRIRQMVGDKPIGMTLDLHANISSTMVHETDIMTGYDTYPHVDIYERAVEASSLLVSTIQEEIKPVQQLGRANLLIAPSRMDTNTEPMKTVMEKAFEYEKDPDVLNVVVAGGFPYSDISIAGVTVAVSTNNDEEKAKQIAKKMTDFIWEKREQFKANVISVEDALVKAKQEAAYPTILIESSDNVGGGSPADATHVLQTLIEQDQDRFLMVIADPESVTKAHLLGVNEQFSGTVGGKADTQNNQVALHGEPVQVEGRIRLLADGHYVHRGPYMGGKKATMGNTAVVELETCEAATIVLTEERVAPWDINHLRSIGIDPEKYEIIVVKSAIAWKTAFGDIAKNVIEVDTPGCCSVNLNQFHYKELPDNLYILGN